MDPIPFRHHHPRPPKLITSVVGQEAIHLIQNHVRSIVIDKGGMCLVHHLSVQSRVHVTPEWGKEVCVAHHREWGRKGGGSVVTEWAAEGDYTIYIDL